MGIPICGACRRPIEERVVTALGKNFHVEVYFRSILYFLLLAVIEFDSNVSVTSSVKSVTPKNSHGLIRVTFKNDHIIDILSWYKK